MAITLHPDIESRLRSRADMAGLSIEMYLERIACEDEAAERDLEDLALEGLNSGDSFEADEAYWAAKRQRLIDRSQSGG